MSDKTRRSDAGSEDSIDSIITDHERRISISEDQFQQFEAELRSDFNALREQVRSDLGDHFHFVSGIERSAIESAARIRLMSDIQDDVTGWLFRRGWWITVIILIVSAVGITTFTGYLWEYIDNRVKDKIFDTFTADSSRVLAKIESARESADQLLTRIQDNRADLNTAIINTDGLAELPDVIRRFNAVEEYLIPQEGILNEQLDDIRTQMSKNTAALADWVFLARTENIHSIYEYFSIVQKNNPALNISTPFQIIGSDVFESNQNIKVWFAVTRRPSENYKERLARVERAMYQLMVRGYHGEVYIYGEKNKLNAAVEDDLADAAGLTSLDAEVVLRKCRRICIVHGEDTALHQNENGTPFVEAALREAFPNAKVDNVIRPFDMSTDLRRVRDYDRAFPETRTIPERNIRIVVVGDAAI